MTRNAQRLQRVAAVTVVCYFIAYTFVCWFLDLAFPGKLATQTRASIFFDAGLVSGLAALLCSFALWCVRRWLAIVGVVACVGWAVWAALPRL